LEGSRFSGQIQSTAADTKGGIWLIPKSTSVPALTAQKGKADSQMRWWLQGILDEIGQNEKGNEK
jgi:hypothetical protein